MSQLCRSSSPPVPWEAPCQPGLSHGQFPNCSGAIPAAQPNRRDHSSRNCSFQPGTEPGSGCGGGQAGPGWWLWPSPTLLELSKADGAGLVTVILLEEASPLLDETQQGREAVDVDAP